MIRNLQQTLYMKTNSFPNRILCVLNQNETTSLSVSMLNLWFEFASLYLKLLLTFNRK